MIITDDSVDVEDIRKIPLYVEWRGKRVRISKLRRNSYFFSVKNVTVELPTFNEIKDILVQAIKEDGKVEVVIPSWPVSFLERPIKLVSAIVDGVHLKKTKMDNVTLSYVLKKNDVNPKKMKEIFERSRTYLLFSDISFLRKNGVLSEENSKMILTKSFNLVRYAKGRTSLKPTWSTKGAIAVMMKEIHEKHFTVDIRHSGRSRMANAVASSFLSNFKCKVSMGWMNPIAASQYGHNTVSVTVIPEV